MFALLKNRFPRFFENELIQRILKNTGYLFSATGITAAMGMLQSILAGRLLGPATFGILGALTAFTSVINRFASFRMSELVIRYVGYYHENNDPQRAAVVFKIACLMELFGSLIAIILIFWLAPLGAEFFAHDQNLAFWFQIYGSIVFANLIFESSTGLLHIFDRFRLISLINVAQSAVTLLLVVIVFFLNGGLVTVVMAYMSGKIAGSLGISIAALAEARKQWGPGWWRHSFRLLSDEMKSIFTFAFSTNISSTVSLIAKDSEVLWVSAFLGTAPAGYYKTALALTGILNLPVSPLPKVTFPELAREIARKNWDNVRYVLRQGTRLAALYSLPVTLFLVIFGRFVISLTYGDDYLPTYEPLIILLAGFTVMNLLYWNRVALLSLARPVFPTVINLIGMLVKVGLIFVLVPRYGYLAFAVLLSGYYIFTVGAAALRVILDLRGRGGSLPENPSATAASGRS